ncbi:hypothetical protein F5Y16DRAFT_380361 [Xylariaceae sp. FL0255]|nr:hypothetical protein F5Y16DRAFT_380361 [Xylariaceae sp. FL0255]
MNGNMNGTGYLKTSANTVIRYRNRGVYDYETINNLIDQTPILHVSFTPSTAPDADEMDTYPVILPMMGFTGDFNDQDAGPDCARSVYLHGYVSSRIMRTSKNQDEGMRVCVASTLLDGVVLALTPNHHSCNYRSAVVLGRAYVVTDEAERLWAMERITDNLIPGRWAATRYPNSSEQKATGILRVEIDTASAKIRTGSTGEDRNDLKDMDLRKRCWNGVLPVYTTWGEPVPADTNMVSKLPAYLENMRKERTEEARTYAISAATPV